MFIRNQWIFFLLVVLVPGCKKSAPEERPVASTNAVSAGQTIARIHWLGKKQILAETNAAHLATLWNLAETLKLEAQTLDKLATAPWRGMGKADVEHLKALTNNAAMPHSLLRPLLDDLVSQESFLEARQLTNRAIEAVIAVNLTPERARLWETNIGPVLQSLTGSAQTAQKARLQWVFSGTNSQAQSRRIEFTRAEQWVLIGCSQGENSLLAEIEGRIRREHSPVARSSTNYWLDLDLDLPRLTAGSSSNSATSWPRLSLKAVGDGQNVRTSGEIQYAAPLSFQHKSWNIPTNLISEPLTSFGALDSGWLPAPVTRYWDSLKFGALPEQLYYWSLEGVPYQSYVAGSGGDTSNLVQNVVEWASTAGNSWLETNGMGKLKQLSTGVGVGWTGIPFMAPFLRLTTNGVAWGGFFPPGATNQALPPELLKELFAHTNMVYYHWEITEPRVENWIDIGQLLRIGLSRAQLPHQSASIGCVKAIGPKLGNCTTAVIREAPNRLSFSRRSSVGLTALELHRLMDWLESARFPYGTFTADPGNRVRYGAQPPPP